MFIQLLLIGAAFAALQLLPPKTGKEKRHGMEANRRSGFDRNGDDDRGVSGRKSAAEPSGNQLVTEPASIPPIVPATEILPEPAPEPIQEIAPTIGPVPA